MGRPPKYHEAFCEEIISLMSEGLSLTAAAAELGIHRDTVYDWESKHSEFSDAIKLARAKRTLSLERDLLSATEGPKVTSRIFALKNACPDEWRDKVQNETTVKVDDTVAGLLGRIAADPIRIHDENKG